MSTVANAWMDDYGRAVRFVIGNRYIENGEEIFQEYRWTPEGYAFVGEKESIAANVASGTRRDSTYWLPPEAAQALYEALGRIFGSTDNTAPVVKEMWDKESGRVDKMLDVLLDIARP